MKSRIIGCVLLLITLCSGIFLKLNPEHEAGLAIFGFLILGCFLGLILALDVFNKKNLKT